MNVLLINPPYSSEERYGRDLGKFGPLNEPLGLAYIGANLERNGHKVTIIDAPALEFKATDICGHMEKEEYDMVGVTMLTPMYARSVEVVRNVSKAFPEIKIVVGGPHPTILPEETLNENKEIDFIVIGEGEIILLNLVNAIENGKGIDDIPGIAYRKSGSVFVNPPPPMVIDLDDLPFPARHLLPMKKYHITKTRTKTSHAFTVSVARGCPFNCAFCCRIFGRKVRHHSVKRIIEEIKMLVDDYGANEINLEADTLTANRKFLFSLCDGLISSGLSKKVSWTCESRIDTVDENVLRKMKEAGCWQTSYGVETGSQRLLDIIHKDITLGQIEKTFTFTKKAGISIRAFYMLGIPTETRKESLKTIAFARKLDARWSQFTVFTPFPGTELYDMAMREGGLKSKNWSDYKTHGGWTKGDLAYVPIGRSIEEMKILQKKAYRAVYIRPKVIIRLLKEIDSIGKLKEYLIGFWVLIKTAWPWSEKKNSIVKISRNDLEKFAKGVYVDSPVYFSTNSLVRYINWKKLDFALTLFKSKNNHIILDFACGNGVMFPTLSGLFNFVVGIDLHTTAATRLKNRFELKNVFPVTANGLKLPFKDKSFSTILTASTLEHFKELDEVVRELARIMEPDGHLLLLVPTENMFYKIGRILFRYKKPEDHYYSAGEIEKVVERFFKAEIKKYFPINILPFISVYRLGSFKKVADRSFH